MALSGYVVLVGAVVGKRSEVGQQTPHYQIQGRAAGIDYRIAVNVRSAQNPPDLLYVADEALIIRCWPPSEHRPKDSTRCPVDPVGLRWTTSGETCSTARQCARYQAIHLARTMTSPTSSSISSGGP